ncbi:hypothetical protein [Gillisia sp. Hel1_33_143]|uniref:hypothetical protein n=1 Tax=Gillisia sp. Hel1_33_143 TaxID=1336796 RepID=UPI000B8349E0|nr:hypothetical protein [Gillisia sp. Hel1_33_143]
MIFRKDITFYKQKISRIEANLEMLKHSNLCFKEKADLRKIYSLQLSYYREKLKSFPITK